MFLLSNQYCWEKLPVQWNFFPVPMFHLFLQARTVAQHERELETLKELRETLMRKFSGSDTSSDELEGIQMALRLPDAQIFHNTSGYI